MVCLLDHLVGAAEQSEREVDAKRAGDLEVHHQFDFGGLLDRQIGRVVPCAPGERCALWTAKDSCLALASE
jgi:hypothetical protein